MNYLFILFLLLLPYPSFANEAYTCSIGSSVTCENPASYYNGHLLTCGDDGSGGSYRNFQANIVNLGSAEECGAPLTRGHCSDGIQNYFETGVDCGDYTGYCGACSPSGCPVSYAWALNPLTNQYSCYESSGEMPDCAESPHMDQIHDSVPIGYCPDAGNRPPAPPPTTSTNGVQDPGEEGIDCGGSLPSCVDYCPDGKTQKLITLNGEPPHYECAFYSLPDGYGNCPPGWSQLIPVQSPDSSPAVDCINESSIAPVIQAAPAVVSANPPNPPATYSQGVPIPTIVTTTGAPVVSNTPGAGAPAGTVSTKETTVTTTGTGTGTGSGDSTTTTTEYYSGPDGTGDLLGTEETTEADEPYTPGTGDGDPGSPGGLGSSDLDSTIEPPVKRNMIGILNSWFNSYPLVSMIKSFRVETSAAVCSVEIGDMWGTALRFDLCRYETLFRSLGAVLILFTQAYAILVVVRGWK